MPARFIYEALAPGAQPDASAFALNAAFGMMPNWLL
jgi:hypothetical protein